MPYDPHVGPFPAALAYADFVPLLGRVAFPDVCCDLVLAGGTIYVNGPEVRSQPNPFDGLRFEMLRIDPFVMRRWLGIPLAGLVNKLVPLAEINPSLAALAGDLVGRCGFPTSLTLQRSLSEARSDPIEHVARLLGRGMPVSHAANAIDVSERQLERRFADELGMTPRTWKAAIRFRSAAMAARRGATLADAAISGGYADQAHFTRAARQLTGLTPRALIAQHVGIVQDAEVGSF